MNTNPDADTPAKFVHVGIGIVLRSIPHKIRKLNPDDPPDAAHQILITRRPDHTVFGGYWELPGGKCDPGESPDRCVLRELYEEVGIAAEIVQSLSVVEHTYPHARVRLHPRVCRLTPSSPQPRALHVAEFRWCPLGQLDEYEFPPANEAIVRELREYIQSLDGTQAL